MLKQSNFFFDYFFDKLYSSTINLINFVLLVKPCMSVVLQALSAIRSTSIQIGIRKIELQQSFQKEQLVY